jgi:hypothetical protein
MEQAATYQVSRFTQGTRSVVHASLSMANSRDVIVEGEDGIKGRERKKNH